MFLLDTNVVSELRKAGAGRANAGVTRWASETPTVLMYVSVITLFELEHGVLLAERSDPRQGATLREWLDGSVVPTFGERVLPANGPIVKRAAALHVPDPAPFRDALIGATALVHDLAIVTRNESDFTRFEGLDVVNPWSTGGVA